MKLLRGESLSARLSRLGKLSPELSMRIARQMADGLDAAHRAGVVHRDLKPGNVMLEGLGDDIRVSITDFGLSRRYHSDTTLADAGQVSGTPGYIAPELLAGVPASPASDVYAFGVVLHEMIAGKRPLAPGLARSSQDPKLEGSWETVVHKCLAPNPADRCQSAGEAVALLESGPVSLKAANFRKAAANLPRRSLIGVGVGGAVGAAGWFASPVIDVLLHPLPQKRFVALMAWPGEPEPNIRPALNTILDVIAASLSRAESSVSDLLILRPGDAGGQVPREPRQAIFLLGVNLVLGASLQVAKETWTLTLRVLEAGAGRVLREKHISSKATDLPLLSERAALATAALLQIHAPPPPKTNTGIFTLSPEATQYFAAAEELRLQPNDAGLDRAIAAYQQALDAQPGFALGYANLAIAYVRKFQITRQEASLRLAETNANRAIQIDPQSPRSVLSRALVDLYSGRTADAMDALARAQKLDPGNTQILMYQAKALSDLNRGPEEEACYHRVLAQRPNFWPAYNELGAMLYRRGKIEEAAAAFEEASAVAPQAVRPLVNAGSMYLLLKRRTDAMEAFRRSLQSSPNELAYINLGNLAFEDKDYTKALDFYQKARELNPRNHQIFRDIGDCYTALGKPAQVRENYTRAADLLEREVKLNPRPGRQWMRLAFYEAKAGRRENAEADLRTGDELGAPEVPAQFFKAQAEAVLGRHEEALRITLQCLDRGLSTVEVDFALDLKTVRADPHYRARVAALKPPVQR
jgi:tetratricopeptide (TPR) repeat protein